MKTSNTGWIVALLLALLCVVLLAALVSVHAADVQQIATDTGILGQILAKIQSILNDYGWSLAAVLASPFIVFRFFQWGKQQAKNAGKKLPRWLLDIASTVAVGGLSYVFLAQDNIGTQSMIIA